MAGKKEKSVSIKKYRRKREFNLGILLFAVVFIYLVVTVIMYLCGDSISVYEVREGSIVRDNSYRGLVIRQETAIPAEADGYVSYYENENSKVKAGEYVYAISGEPLDTEAESGEEAAETSVDPAVLGGITLQLQNFNENYSPEDFSAVYALKNEMATSLQAVYSETRTQQLGTVIEQSGQEVASYAAQRDGIVAYTVDGMEGLTKDTFTEKDFNNTEYEATVLSDQTKIKSGDPVYRMITSEDWSVIVPLERETAEDLTAEEVTSIRVRADKDSETMWGDFSIIERDGAYYGCLDFDNSMIRYAGERFLSIELILEDESGLKIPKSAVVEEEFYVIPKDYITTGGNSSADGIMVQTRGGAEFRKVDIYNETDGGDVYISREDLDDGDVLIRPDSTETYTVGKKGKLKGVYNINRGYAVFKKVTVLCENDEYYIVQEGEEYGLSNYDHIVQNGAGITPEEVVFQ